MMQTLFNDILSYLFIKLENFKGEKRLVVVPTTDEDILKVKAKSIFNYTVEIQVKRILYNCIYENSFFKHKQFVTFEVSSLVEDTAPEGIKEAFSKTYTFPKMLPKFIPLKHHMNRAVNSYIDMIINESIKDI